MESWSTRGVDRPGGDGGPRSCSASPPPSAARRRSLAAETTPGSPGATDSALLVRLTLRRV